MIEFIVTMGIHQKEKHDREWGHKNDGALRTVHFLSFPLETNSENLIRFKKYIIGVPKNIYEKLSIHFCTWIVSHKAIVGFFIVSIEASKD